MKWGVVVLGLVVLAGIYAIHVSNHTHPISVNHAIFANHTIIVPDTSTPAPTPTPTPAPAPIRIERVSRPHALVLTAVIGQKQAKKHTPEVPKNYYHYPFRKYRPTYTNLIRVLEDMPCPHRMSKSFQCTKYAAFGEWYLENHGFETDIVTFTWGKRIGGRLYITSGHSIVLVHTLNGKYYVDPSYVLYGEHGERMVLHSLKDEVPSGCRIISVTIYHNIYQAINDLGYKTWDWWDYTGYPPRCLR